MIKYVKHNGKILAVIIGNEHRSEGIEFFTPPDFSQQLAYMHHPAGKSIQPHFHNYVLREVSYTQEALFIKRGRVRVDFYNDKKIYIESIILETGDVILLASGGHGFEILEESEIIEVKQGPYSGEEDKTRFDPH